MKRRTFVAGVLREIYGGILEFVARDTSFLRNRASGNVQVGSFTYGSPIIRNLHNAHGQVSLGKYCSLGKDVVFLTGGNHHVDWITTFPIREKASRNAHLNNDGASYSKGPISVGNDVWIGDSAVILSGVTIGDGAVIGAYSVVARDVAPYSIVVGNPARVVRNRFSAEDVDFLLRTKWWDKDASWVVAHADLLQSPDLSELRRVLEETDREDER